MACTIINSSFTGCESTITSAMQSVIATIPELSTTLKVYGLAEARKDSNNSVYPSIAIEDEDCHLTYIDLFPHAEGQQLGDSYCFFYLSDTIRKSVSTDSVLIPLSLIFHIKKDRFQKEFFASELLSALENIDGINDDIRFELRSRNVWSDFEYDIDTFMQYQDPYYCLKVSFAITSYAFDCVCDFLDEVIDIEVTTPNNVDTFITEGQCATITINATGVANGTEWYYEISGNNVTQTDIDIPLTGNVTINNGTATIIMCAELDGLIEGNEVAYINIYRDNTLNSLIGVVSVLLINLDIAPIYEVLADKTEILEGGDGVIVKVNVPSLIDGTSLYYTITGTTLDDIDIPLEGEAMIMAGTLNLHISAVSDIVQNDNQLMTIEWFTDAAKLNSIGSVDVDIVDQTPVYDLITTMVVNNPYNIRALNPNEFLLSINSAANLYRYHFDGSVFTLLATINVNAYPYYMDLRSNLVSFAAYTGGVLYEVDLNTNSIVKTATTGKSQVAKVLFDPLYNRYIVTSNTSAPITTDVNFANQTPIAGVTRSFDVNFSNDFYFMSTGTQGRLVKIDRATATVIANIPIAANTFQTKVWNEQYVIVQVFGTGLYLYDFDLNFIAFEGVASLIEFDVDQDGIVYSANTLNWNSYDISTGQFIKVSENAEGLSNRGIGVEQPFVYVADVQGDTVRAFERVFP